MKLTSGFFMLSDNTRGITYVLLAALTVALLPNSAKLALEDGVNTSTLLLGRGLVGVAILSLIIFFSGKSIRLPKHLFWLSFGTGIGAVFFIIGLYLAIQHIDVSLAMLILYLYPVCVAIYNHFSGVSRLTIFRIAWSCMALLGICLTVSQNLEIQSFEGIAWAFFSMLCASAVTILNNRPAKELGSLIANYHLTLWGAVLFTVGFFLFGELALPQTNPGWAGLITNGSVYCFTWFLFFAGSNLIGTTRASMISVVDLLFAAAMAYFLFGEWFSHVQWFGFFIVFFSLIALETPKGFWRKTFGR